MAGGRHAFAPTTDTRSHASGGLRDPAGPSRVGGLACVAGVIQLAGRPGSRPRASFGCRRIWIRTREASIHPGRRRGGEEDPEDPVDGTPPTTWSSPMTCEHGPCWSHVDLGGPDPGKSGAGEGGFAGTHCHAFAPSCWHTILRVRSSRSDLGLDPGSASNVSDTSLVIASSIHAPIVVEGWTARGRSMAVLATQTLPADALASAARSFGPGNTVGLRP